MPEGKIDCEGEEAEGWKLMDDGWGWACEGEGLYAEAEVLNVEELEIVGEGWTGPNCERREM